MSGAGDPSLEFAALDALLQRALELPPAERDAFALAACGSNAARLTALRNLLSHCDDTDSDWERLPHDYARANADALDGGVAPQPVAFANWRVIGSLGEGGMAQVFLAERKVEGVVQRAAIKLMAAHRAGPELRARFDRERRILAKLNDPRIARFIDAGVLADGRPWLAMEYVEGVRIDEWCDQQRLSLEGRLRLLIQVARAIGSAHSRLIVHRDIKPANVLVDIHGVPRVLDFGIAKILDDDEAAGDETRTQQRLMTLQYASPEQLLGETVDTASDIYQLGLMLFELCTGRRPFAELEGSLPRMLRALAEEAAPTLRRAFEATATEAAAIAAARASTVARLRRALGGDLKRIAAKALQRDPAQRYASVLHFADDLASCLDSRPVSATPPSWRYRTQRLIARHPLGAVLSLALLVAVAAGVGATLWQTREALHQRDQARAEAEKSRRLTEFLTSVFAQANPSRNQGEAVSAKSLLDAALARIDSELPQRDGVRSDLLAAMATAYSGLALRETQLKLALDALAIERELDRPEVLTRRLVLAGTSTRESGDAAGAMKLFDEAESRLRTDPAASQGFLGHLLFLKAMTHYSLRDAARSEQVLEQALQILLAAPDAREADIQSTQLMLTRRWASAGKYDQAIAVVSDLIARIRVAQPARPTELVQALDALGSAYGKAGRLPQQTATYREALALAETTYGPEHFDVAVLNHNLARALDAEGDRAGALPNAERAVALGALSVGPAHNFTVAARLALVRLRCLNGDRNIGNDDWVALEAGSAKFPQFAPQLAQNRADCAEGQ